MKRIEEELGDGGGEGGGGGGGGGKDLLNSYKANCFVLKQQYEHSDVGLKAATIRAK